MGGTPKWVHCTQLPLIILPFFSLETSMNTAPAGDIIEGLIGDSEQMRVWTLADFKGILYYFFITLHAHAWPLIKFMNKNPIYYAIIIIAIARYIQDRIEKKKN